MSNKSLNILLSVSLFIMIYVLALGFVDHLEKRDPIVITPNPTSKYGCERGGEERVKLGGKWYNQITWKCDSGNSYLISHEDLPHAPRNTTH